MYITETTKTANVSWQHVYLSTVPSATVKTNGTGSVTITAQARTSCGGSGALLSQTYELSAPTPVCPTGIVFPTYWCINQPNPITLQGAQSDLTYTLSTYNMVPLFASVTFAATSTPGRINATLVPNGSRAYPKSFGVLVTVSSPCPGSGPGVVTCTSAPLFPNSVTTMAVSCGKAAGPRNIPGSAVLYPNPTNGHVDVVPSGTVRYEAVKVMDIQGRLVLEEKAPTEGGIKTFDVKNLPAGLYQVQLFTGGRMETQRLVKE